MLSIVDRCRMAGLAHTGDHGQPPWLLFFGWECGRTQWLHLSIAYIRCITGWLPNAPQCTGISLSLCRSGLPIAP